MVAITSRIHGRGPRRALLAISACSSEKEGSAVGLGERGRVRADVARPSRPTSSRGTQARRRSASTGSTAAAKLCDVDTSKYKKEPTGGPLPRSRSRPRARRTRGRPRTRRRSSRRRSSQRRGALRVGQRRRHQAGRQHPAARLPEARRDGRRADGPGDRGPDRPRRAQGIPVVLCAGQLPEQQRRRSRPSPAPTTCRASCGRSGSPSRSAARGGSR